MTAGTVDAPPTAVATMPVALPMAHPAPVVMTRQAVVRPVTLVPIGEPTVGRPVMHRVDMTIPVRARSTVREEPIGVRMIAGMAYRPAHRLIGTGTRVMRLRARNAPVGRVPPGSVTEAIRPAPKQSAGKSIQNLNSTGIRTTGPAGKPTKKATNAPGSVTVGMATPKVPNVGMVLHRHPVLIGMPTAVLPGHRTGDLLTAHHAITGRTIGIAATDRTTGGMSAHETTSQVAKSGHGLPMTPVSAVARIGSARNAGTRSGRDQPDPPTPAKATHTTGTTTAELAAHAMSGATADRRHAMNHPAQPARMIMTGHEATTATNAPALSTATAAADQTTAGTNAHGAMTGMTDRNDPPVASIPLLPVQIGPDLIRLHLTDQPATAVRTATNARHPGGMIVGQAPVRRSVG